MFITPPSKLVVVVVELLVLRTVLEMLVSNTLALQLTYTLRKKGSFYAEGEVLFSSKVRSDVECGTMCTPSGCVGYHIMENSTYLECTTFTTVYNYTQHLDYRYYCSDCRYKNEPCTADVQCAQMTLYAVCDPTTNLCTCNTFTSDDGPRCTPKPASLSESCGIDEQCVATTNYTQCDTSLPDPVCVCATNYTLTPTADACVFDYVGFGFVSHNGRLVYHWHPLLPMSWEGAHWFCAGIHATMFQPRDEVDWQWMSGEIHLPFLGLHFPINDQAQEGTLVWNDGTSAENVPFLQWALGSPSWTNSILANCVWMLPAVPFVSPSTITFKPCIFPELVCVICEAN